MTPKLRMINNANFLWFDKTAALQTFVFQGKLDRDIGVDLSSGIEYRPLLSNNIIVLAGAACLLPSNGFRQLYGAVNGHKPGFLASTFVEITFAY